jgi:Flp pilus assembly protein TadB
MLIVALGVVGLLAGLPIGLLIVVMVALAEPLLFLVLVALWSVLANWVLRGRVGPGEEAAFLRALAGELAGGSSLRTGLIEAALRSPELGLDRVVRLSHVGASATQIGAALQSALPLNGAVAASAFRLADAAGGRVGPVMLTLAGRAEEVSTLERERRALTAQARASAWLVGGAPVALLSLLAVMGTGSTWRDLSGSTAWVLGVGFGLVAFGVSVVAWMVRRS